MTPTELETLARRVETEEPTNELRALVLTAFGSEAEPHNAPDPLRSVDDAIAGMPEGWSCLAIYQSRESRWAVALGRRQPPIDEVLSVAPTEPRARTAAALMALVVDARGAGA